MQLLLLLTHDMKSNLDKSSKVLEAFFVKR